MRAIISAVAVSLLAGALQPAFMAAPLGQERAGIDLRHEAYREWQDIANGRTDFEVSDPALVPRQLALAAQQSGCHYRDDIKNVPLRFLGIEKRRLALVFCSGPIGSHQLFDISDLTRPKLIEFPFLAQPEGFGTTSRPGAIAWRAERNVFQAVTGSDLLPTLQVRHTYRLDTSDAALVVVRVEVRHVPGTEEWATIWEAPRWSFPTQPSAH